MCATKAKTPVKKTAASKKVATQTPVKAKPAKEAKAKKPAAKEAPAKKKVEAKPAKPVKAAKPAPAAKKEAKPVKKAVAVAPKKPAPAPKKEEKAKKAKASTAKKPKANSAKDKASENLSNPAQDLVFKFAERRKQEQLEAERKEAESRIVIKPGRRPTTRQKGSNTQKFPAADLEAFRKVLLALRSDAIGQSRSLKVNALEQTEDRSREDDDGSDVTIRLQNLSQVDVKSKDIQKIDEALRRIDNGTYGICEECGQLIRKQRLANMPTARHCIECQQKIEKMGR